MQLANLTDMNGFQFLFSASLLLSQAASQRLFFKAHFLLRSFSRHSVTQCFFDFSYFIILLETVIFLSFWRKFVTICSPGLGIPPKKRGSPGLAMDALRTTCKNKVFAGKDDFFHHVLGNRNFSRI